MKPRRDKGTDKREKNKREVDLLYSLDTYQPDINVGGIYQRFGRG